ncbi:MAG: hypothetical protein JKY70_13225 [Mucilaginibacter sp.]|nr:hypothetical protein [Mucilaginibacter sp.]
MDFLSKLYIFTNLLIAADNHRQSQDPLFRSFGELIQIVGPDAANRNGKLIFVGNADMDARLLVKILWNDAMYNYQDYIKDLPRTRNTTFKAKFCMN